MALLAMILGILGGLCAAMGIVTATEAFEFEILGAGFTAMFWLTLGVVFLLGCIAAAVSRSAYE